MKSSASNIFQSIHLSASAGSGKTRALKERYLALLDALDARALKIDQAVAITFTEKAAAEIKERVMQDLPEATLKKIIRGRQDLRISTIHSFCMNLLKRYPLEAGLPPDFGVLDARDQSYKIQKAVEDALEESDRDRTVMAPLNGFTADELIAALEFLLSVRSRLKRMEIDAGGSENLVRTMKAGMGFEQVETELKTIVTGEDWRADLMGMEQVLRSQGAFYEECLAKEHLRLAETNEIETAFTITGSLGSIYFNKDGSPGKKCYIAKNKYTGRDRDDYEKLYFSLQASLGRFRTAYARLRAAREAMSLLRLFRLSEDRYQAAKLREGLLDFDDLEIYAYRLLRGLDSPDILYWLDRKILHFLVDEFQDTSDIQWAVLDKLTEEIFAGQGVEKRMTPTLFVVGDEKQSIYRFREANYRLIRDVRRKMEKNLPEPARQVLTLDTNYRSAPEIIETVNRVFGTLWGEAYTPSEAERKAHRGSVRLIEIAGTSPENPAANPSEAEVLAREIRNFIETGSVVYDKEDAGWTERNADYGDCAILIHSRTRLKEYEAALQAESIPYRVIGGIGFYEEGEIQALLNVLFFLWNRDDSLALAAALKSPLFSLTDRDIFDCINDDAGMVEALRSRKPEVAALLQGWLNLAGLAPLASLLHRIVEDTAAYIRFGGRNLQAIFNIDKLLDTAREFDRRGYTTLQDFVEWVKHIRESEQREATADINLPGFRGSVSIMTVHKAKGLEYPVVFLPGMNQQPKSLSTGPLAIIDDSGNRVRMAIKDAVNPLYDELWDRERGELLHEHQRLLYVAMTRARDHLVMTGALNENARPVKQNTWLSWLHEAGPKPLFDSDREPVPGIRVYEYGQGSGEPGMIEQAGPTPAREQEPTDELFPGTLIENLSPVPRSGSPEWKRATDFIHREKEDTAETLPVTAPAAAVSPMTRGNVLHRCLEDFTKTGRYDVHRLLPDYPDLQAQPSNVRRQFADDANALLSTVLRTKEHAWIFEAGEDAYSELPFLLKKSHTLVTGIIDRVVIRKGRGFVIDYKAISVENDAALDAWLGHYRPQIGIYCEAVKEIFGLANVEGYLLFLDSNKLAMCFRA